jgi:hypothetical protein
MGVVMATTMTLQWTQSSYSLSYYWKPVIGGMQASPFFSKVDMIEQCRSESSAVVRTVVRTVVGEQALREDLGHKRSKSTVGQSFFRAFYILQIFVKILLIITRLQSGEHS